jgi:hypothetical protein
MKSYAINDTKESSAGELTFHHQKSLSVFSEGKQWIKTYNPYLNLECRTQTRLYENRGIIKKYGQAMFEGNWNWLEGEPIVLFWDQKEKHLFCGDGHHRLKAAQEQYLHQIYVEIRFGTFLDAKIFNCTSNGTHGHRTTNKDKRNQILTLLKTLDLLPIDDPRRRWSDREIGRRIGVDHKTVGRVRRSLVNPLTEEQKAEIVQKKALNKKNKQFYSFRKLVQECNQDELINYLNQIDQHHLSKLKLVIEQVL